MRRRCGRCELVLTELFFQETKTVDRALFWVGDDRPPEAGRRGYLFNFMVESLDNDRSVIIDSAEGGYQLVPGEMTCSGYSSICVGGMDIVEVGAGQSQSPRTTISLLCWRETCQS